jgi:hypothetical protein
MSNLPVFEIQYMTVGEVKKQVRAMKKNVCEPLASKKDELVKQMGKFMVAQDAVKEPQPVVMRMKEEDGEKKPRKPRAKKVKMEEAPKNTVVLNMPEKAKKMRGRSKKVSAAAKVEEHTEAAAHHMVKAVEAAKKASKKVKKEVAKAAEVIAVVDDKVSDVVDKAKPSKARGKVSAKMITVKGVDYPAKPTLAQLFANESDTYFLDELISDYGTAAWKVPKLPAKHYKTELIKKHFPDLTDSHINSKIVTPLNKRLKDEHDTYIKNEKKEAKEKKSEEKKSEEKKAVKKPAHIEDAKKMIAGGKLEIKEVNKRIKVMLDTVDNLNKRIANTPEEAEARDKEIMKVKQMIKVLTAARTLLKKKA